MTFEPSRTEPGDYEDLDALPAHLGPEQEMNWLQQAVLDSRHDEHARRAFDASSQFPGLCVRACAFVCSKACAPRREAALFLARSDASALRLSVPLFFSPFHSPSTAEQAPTLTSPSTAQQSPASTCPSTEKQAPAPTAARRKNACENGGNGKDGTASQKEEKWKYDRKYREARRRRSLPSPQTR